MVTGPKRPSKKKDGGRQTRSVLATTLSSSCLAVSTVAAPTPVPQNLVSFTDYPVSNVLEKLLIDKTTGRRLTLGGVQGAPSEITPFLLSRKPTPVLPRVEKSREAQGARTKKNAEVFTPSWLCAKMNDFLDGEILAAKNAKDTKYWQNYVDVRILEITCGEAPFIVSRYDAASGKLIPVKERIGLLDRKLRAVNENAADEEEWMKWAGEQEAYAFDLNLFFETDGNGRFRHDADVDRFLDALTREPRFPFSTPKLRDELKHTFWLLNRVDSAKALVRKLREHPVFKDYEVVLAAGDGKLEDDENEIRRSYDKVVHAIAEYEKTITVSVGQLTTGVTVPEWTGVLMLCSMKSPAQYMQAAFRAQNPCLFSEGKGFRRKTDAYVFDFDPARTLIIFEQFANDLCSDTAAGRGDSESRRRNIGELLNFFPVIGEEEGGELVELDAERVLSIPRRIKSADPSSSWENFLGTDTSGGWTFEEKKEAFDWYLVWLGTNDCKRLSIHEQDLIDVAISRCEWFSYTNSIDSLKALVRNPRGVQRDRAIEAVVKLGAVDNEMTQFIESIATNAADYTLMERSTSMYEYEQRLCGYAVTNAATTNAVQMFNRLKYLGAFSAVPCDIVFSGRVEGYAVSSNRLEYANWALGYANPQSNVAEYFTSVTNQLLSSGQPLPWINVGTGGN